VSVSLGLTSQSMGTILVLLKGVRLLLERIELFEGRTSDRFVYRMGHALSLVSEDYRTARCRLYARNRKLVVSVNGAASTSPTITVNGTNLIGSQSPSRMEISIAYQREETTTTRENIRTVGMTHRKHTTQWLLET